MARLPSALAASAYSPRMLTNCASASSVDTGTSESGSSIARSRSR